jgi:benzodiazapine receptor
MATLYATLRETARLPWVNAAFFALQTLLTCVGLAVGDAAVVRAQHDSLLTPASYAFSIWNAIYLLCMILLVTDVSYAGLSLYDSAAKPNALRLCFAASCVANGAWCIALASGDVLAASVLVSLLWLTLLPLYVFASYERNVQTVLWHEYLCSELCVRLYFAWITVEAVVGWTMAIQLRHGGDFLPLSTYLSLLAVLLVAALSGLSYGRDPIMALVVAWALVGVTSKDVSGFDSAAFAEFEKVQAAATLGAGVLVAMALVSCSYWAIEFNWYGGRSSSSEATNTSLTCAAGV